MFNRHTPTPQNLPPTAPLHNPAALSLPHYILTELPLLSQHVNNVKEAVLVLSY